MKPSKPIKTKKKKSGNVSLTAYNRPYNRYNLYFILERENLILAKGGTPKTSALLTGDPGFDGLDDLPPLPPRFEHLKMPDGWCIPGHQKKRPHRKTHGVATFRELARCIAKSWKTIDGATLAYCAAVEKILKKRHEELKKANPGWSKPKPKSHQVKQSKEATTKQRPDLAKQHNNNEEAFPDGTTTRVPQAASSATTADLLDRAQACFLQAQAREPAMPEFNVCGDNGLSNNGTDVPPSYNNAMMMMTMMSYNHNHSNNQARPSRAQLTSNAAPRQAYDARNNGSASQANASEMFGGDANGNSRNRNTESNFQMFGDGINNNAATATTNFNGMNNHGNDNATASRMADKIEALAASIRASQESSMTNSVNNRSIQNSMQGSLNSSDQCQSNPLSMAPNHPLFNSNAMLLNNQDHLFANMLNARDVHNNNNNNALLRSQDIINNLHHRDSIPNGMSNNQSSSIANHHAQHQHPIPCSEVQIDPMLDGYHSPDTNDDTANVTSNNGKSSLRGGDIFDVPEGAGEEDDAASLFAPNEDPSGLELVDIDDATLANISDDDIRSMWYEDF